MVKYFSFLLLLVFISCQTKFPTANKNNYANSEINIDSFKVKLHKKEGLVDIEINSLLDRHVTPNNNYYQFIPISDSTFRIHWGNDTIHNISQEIYYKIDGIRQMLDWENNEFVALIDGHGTNADFNIILPIKKDSKEIIVNNPLAVNKKSHLIVSFYDCYNDTLLKVINFENGMVIPIIDHQIKCYTEITSHCIKKIEIIKDELVVNWQYVNENEKTDQNVFKKYKIYAR
jgi:hypothetical protein